MKTVFICHPFQGNKKNLELTKQYCKLAIERNCCPFAPALHYPQFLDDSNHDDRECGLRCGLLLLNCCEELWICGDAITNGMSDEINFAGEHEIKIRHVRLE